MAYPEANESRPHHSGNRDPRAIETPPSFDWMTGLGVAAAIAFLLLLIGAFSTDQSATNAPADNRPIETPATPPPARPAP
jgi:hypothetical protein